MDEPGAISLPWAFYEPSKHWTVPLFKPIPDLDEPRLLELMREAGLADSPVPAAPDSPPPPPPPPLTPSTPITPREATPAPPSPIASPAVEPTTAVVWKTVTVAGSNKRWYPCTVAGCDKRFAQRQTRHRHVRTIHMGLYNCPCTAPGCTRKFADACHLREHVQRYHTPASPASTPAPTQSLVFGSRVENARKRRPPGYLKDTNYRPRQRAKVEQGGDPV